MMVEHITPPPGVTPSAMREAANFLNAMLRGRTLSDAARAVEREIAARLDRLKAAVIAHGCYTAFFSGPLRLGEFITAHVRALLSRRLASDADRPVSVTRLGGVAPHEPATRARARAPRAGARPAGC